MPNATKPKFERLNTPSTPLALYRVNGAGETVAAELETPLVLGHALGSSKDMWSQVLEHLPGNLPLIVWEQPGHGQSALLEEENPSALDTAAALRRGLLDLGLESVHVAGLSLGGMISLAFAQRFPEDVVSLAVLDSGPSGLPAEPWLEKADAVEKDGLAHLVEPTMQRWFTPAFAEGEGRDEVEKIRNIFLRTDPRGYAQCCRILSRTDLRAGLQAITAPTLILTGAEDPGTTPRQAEQLAEAIPGADTIVIVDSARHLSAVEQPAVVANALVSHVFGK